MQRESVRWLFLEGTAIVVSILLAFAIDAWWDQAQKAQLEQTQLASLKRDIQFNLEALEEGLNFHRSVVESAQRLFELSASPRESREPDEVDSLLGDLGWFWAITFATGTLDSLLSSGNLEVIDDHLLKSQLASALSSFEFVKSLESQSYEVLHRDYWPTLAEKGYLPQIHSTAMRNGMPGGARYEVQEPYALMQPPTDHTSLLDDKEFMGIILMKKAAHDDAIQAYTISKFGHETTLQIVEKNLERG